MLHQPTMTRFHSRSNPLMEERLCGKVELLWSRAGDSPVLFHCVPVYHCRRPNIDLFWDDYSQQKSGPHIGLV